jgi:hypothetical protein
MMALAFAAICLAAIFAQPWIVAWSSPWSIGVGRARIPETTSLADAISPPARDRRQRRHPV